MRGRRRRSWRSAVAVLAAGCLGLLGACASESDGDTAATSTLAATTTSSTTTTISTTTATIAPTTTTPLLEDLYASVQGGVLPVTVVTCDGLPSGGTAFLVDSDHAVTSAHVVAGTELVEVEHEGELIEATVVGFDPTLDVAVLRLDEALDEYAFTLSDEIPRTGATVAAIGFPLDESRTLTLGVVSGSDRSGDFDGQHIIQLIQTDVSLNRGNSGGPLVSDVGLVVGIAAGGARDADGINYAAIAALARPVIDSWIEADSPVSMECPSVLTTLLPTADGDPTVALAELSLADYFLAINESRYEDARLRIAPWKRLSASTWAEGMSTTSNVDIDLHFVEAEGVDARAWVTFTSLQAADKGPRSGETCTDWSIDYTMIPADDGLMWIESARGHAGGPISEPCP